MGGKEGESSGSRGQLKLRTRFHELAHQESEHTVSKSTGTCIDIVLICVIGLIYNFSFAMGVLL